MNIDALAELGRSGRCDNEGNEQSANEQSVHGAASSMIPKSGTRFSEKIMLHHKT
jgi:hypothetical protein